MALKCATNAPPVAKAVARVAVNAASAVAKAVANVVSVVANAARPTTHPAKTTPLKQR